MDYLQSCLLTNLYEISIQKFSSRIRKVKRLSSILSVPQTTTYFLKCGSPSKLEHTICTTRRGTFINDVPCFLTIFDLPTYLVPTTSLFGGFLGPPPPLPTLIWDIINERSLEQSPRLIYKC